MEPRLFAMENGGLLPRDDGYRGIWYYNQPSGDEYVYKYSGGLGTYPHCHVPISIYAPEVNRTFFVYGGAKVDVGPGNVDENELVHCISYFDHETGTVPRPAILLSKATSDAHDNPTMTIDGDGHIWVFSNAHGPADLPSYTGVPNPFPSTGSSTSRPRTSHIVTRGTGPEKGSSPFTRAIRPVAGSPV